MDGISLHHLLAVKQDYSSASFIWLLLELNVAMHVMYLKQRLVPSKYSVDVSHNSNNNLISFA